MPAFAPDAISYRYLKQHSHRIHGAQARAVHKYR
jgi:hypothetical protein